MSTPEQHNGSQTCIAAQTAPRILTVSFSTHLKQGEYYQYQTLLLKKQILERLLFVYCSEGGFYYPAPKTSVPVPCLSLAMVLSIQTLTLNVRCSKLADEHTASLSLK